MDTNNNISAITPSALSLTNDYGTPQPLRWLVSDRIPLGRITLLVGSADSGKTSVAMDLSSRIASGEFWPEITETDSEDEEEAEEYPGDPTLVKTYTSPSGSYNVYTTRPVSRSESGAPPENTGGTPPASETNTVNENDEAQHERQTRECHSVLVLTPFQNSKQSAIPRLLTLNPNPVNVFFADPAWSADSPPLAALIPQLRQTLEERPSIKLLVIDAITSLLAASMTPRRLLPGLVQELSDLADEKQIAILALMPLIGRSNHSVEQAILNVHAAASYLLSFDSQNPNLRTMQTIKFPGHTAPAALVVDIKEFKIDYRLDEDLSALANRKRLTEVEDEEDSDDSEVAMAVDFLKEILEPGPCSYDKIMSMAGKADISAKTLYRAKQIIGAKSYRVHGVVGFLWLWSINSVPDPKRVFFDE